MDTGIYEIKNAVNGKQYIGSAVHFAERWQRHRRDLRNNAHRNCVLQSAWNKYGKDAFSFHKLLVCSRDNLLFYEQRVLDAFNPEYNIFPSAGSALGYKHSPEALLKIASIRRGIKHTPETLARISASNTGKKRTEEQRQKLRGRTPSPEARAAVGIKLRGFKHSDEARANMSRAQRSAIRSQAQLEQGRKLNQGNVGRKHSEETRARQSAARLGKPRPASVGEKVSAAHKGRTFSTEWRAKLSEAAKLRVLNSKRGSGGRFGDV